MQRPDTPLANTSEPAPVSSGLQPMNGQYSQPVSKYQATADAAIQQISKLSQESIPQPGAPAQSSNQEPQQ
jgi:hypothetical protein